MITQVSIEDNHVLLEDNSGRQIALSGKMSFDDFNEAISKLDFAYGLRRWAVKYFVYVQG